MPVTTVRTTLGALPNSVPDSSSVTLALDPQAHARHIANVRRRNLDAFFMIMGGVTTTAIGVLYAAEKHRIAAILSVLSGIGGTIYGTIRYIEDYPVDTPMA